MIASGNIGKVEIQMKLLFDPGTLADMFSELKLLPLQIDYDLSRRIVTYTCWCESFPKLPPHSVVPIYTIEEQRFGTPRYSINTNHHEHHAA